MRAVRAAWRFLRGEPFALVGAAIYALIVVTAVFAEKLAPHDPREILRAGRRVARYLPISPEHWLGTTSSGRDVLSQLIWGTRSALQVGLTAAVVVVAIGTLMGLMAGYLGGWVDRLITRLADIVLSLPFLPFMLVLAALTRPGTTVVVVCVALLLWPNTARVIRSQVLSMNCPRPVAVERGFRAAALPALSMRMILPISDSMESEASASVAAPK